MPVSTEEEPALNTKRQSHDPDDVRMSFGDHLEELRKRLILSLVGVGIGAIITFYFGRDIVAWLQEPLHRAQVVTGRPPGTISMKVTTAFAIYMKVSLLSAVVLVMPWVVYQLWKFISAGLYYHERRIVYLLAPFSAGMMVLGVAFLYYVMLPVTLGFFLFFADSYPQAGGQRPSLVETITSIMGFESRAPDPPPEETARPIDANASLRLEVLPADPTDPVPGQMWISRDTLKYFDGEQVLMLRPERGGSLHTLFEIEYYISFVLFLMLGVIIAFQLPVVMTVAGWSGLVDPAWLVKMRKYAVFFLFAIAAVLTPADPLSLFVLAIPLCLLFEMGLMMMRLTYTPPEPAEDEADDASGNEPE